MKWKIVAVYPTRSPERRFVAIQKAINCDCRLCSRFLISCEEELRPLIILPSEEAVVPDLLARPVR